MPATITGGQSRVSRLLGAKPPCADACVVGVDGCKGGWVAVTRTLSSGRSKVSLWRRFDLLLEQLGPGAAAIMVDMPIGMPDHGKRACETLARKRLAPKRHSSVFASPARPMISFDTYQEANKWGKQTGHGGLMKQTWMITPKIREVDALLQPQDQSILSEAHPELAFWRLNDENPCHHPKKTLEGQKERLALLHANGCAAAASLIDQARVLASTMSGVTVAIDDVMDACALSLTARARLRGDAIQLTDGARDARGLLMEIWG